MCHTLLIMKKEWTKFILANQLAAELSNKSLSQATITNICRSDTLAWVGGSERKFSSTRLTIVWLFSFFDLREVWAMIALSKDLWISCAMNTASNGKLHCLSVTTTLKLSRLESSGFRWNSRVRLLFSWFNSNSRKKNQLELYCGYEKKQWLQRR